MKNLLIKNGLVVTEKAETICDVLCQGETIKAIGKDISPSGEAGQVQVIDATGKLVIPGGVDVHTHLNLDVGIAVASDDFYTGTVAAAFGGTTTIVDHPAFGPEGCSLDHQIKKYHGFANNKAVIDYSFHGVIQHVDKDVLQMMQVLATEGIASYKIYLTYGFKLSDADVFRVLERAKELGVMITVHPENDGVINVLRERFVDEGKTSPAYHPCSRPAECEAEAINRMVLFARMAGDAPLYIVHLSNALGLEYIRNGRMRGQKNLYAETCPQYLLLNDSRYELPWPEGLKYIMCPPLRKPSDQESLWQGLAADIDTVATDHCPFFFETQKMMGKEDFTKCPSGAPGIEERIPLMYSEGVVKGRISLRRFTDLCCTNPAKLFGMYPHKGVIQEGTDADIVIMDPEKKVTLGKNILHGNVDYCAYEGTALTGFPVCTISRGEVIVRDGVFTGQTGRGRFIHRKGGSPKQ
ncbi:MAG: dihydropyrimidinase [Treponema sp.]|jgi:dihydropyrimidinase|nr:dihydropyrimidinase [Treponema sp.]